MTWLKKITLTAVMAILLGILTTASLTSCGKGDKDAAGTEQEGDHPAEESEEAKEDHPAESDSTDVEE